MVSFDLNDLIREIYLFFHPKIKIGFDYSCEIMYNKFFIEGDKEKIRQIISCLISNSMKFTPAGKISFGYTLKDSQIQFFVRDTGIGISPVEHEKIFKRFYQAKNEMTMKSGGSGLGLNITKGLVELMNGKIWIDSEVGKGSTFFFTIPFKNSKIIATNDHENDIDFSGVKILIAEDEPTNFQFLRIILTIKGAIVEWAKNGTEAVKMVQNHKPDLVLMDLKMPVMDGLESSRQIRKMYPDLPIIAQTAYSLPEEKELAEKIGLNKNSVVLVFSTEGDTDTKNYRDIVWYGKVSE
jgi:CheY-like chemotaxis protein